MGVREEVKGGREQVTGGREEVKGGREEVKGSRETISDGGIEHELMVCIDYWFLRAGVIRRFAFSATKVVEY